MKGTNLNPTIVAKLRENTSGPGGMHHFDLSSANAGPKEVSLTSDCIKYNYQSCEGMAPLISIDLSGNSICGIDFLMQGVYDSDGFNDFCNTLINMSKISRLRKLNLSRNFLDAKGFALVSNLLVNGPQSLIELNLRSCGGDFDAIEKLSEGLKSNKNLVTLDLKQNHFGKGGAELLGDYLAGNNKLKQLNISECGIDSDGAVFICKGLSSNDCLEILSMGDNNIGDAGCEAIAGLFRATKRLKHVDIQENRIGQEGITVIASALAKNRSLVFLGLQWNDLSNEGAARLGEALIYNNSLKSIHIVGNHIDADGISLMIESSLACDEKPVDLDLGFAYARPTSSNNKVKPSVRPAAIEEG